MKAATLRDLAYFGEKIRALFENLGDSLSSADISTALGFTPADAKDVDDSTDLVLELLDEIDKLKARVATLEGEHGITPPPEQSTEDSNSNEATTVTADDLSGLRQSALGDE